MSRVLWIKHDRADNHYDESFLASLHRNRNVREYKFTTLVADSSLLVLNISLGGIFALAFFAIYTNKWDAKWFAFGAAPVTLGLGTLWAKTTEQRVDSVKSLVLCIFIVMALAPVLRSLTESTSSDTIWAVATWLGVANVVLSTRPMSERHGILVLSSNTALAVTIVLASRLQTSREVFYFIMFSIQTYVALPTAARWLWADRGVKSYAILVICGLAVATFLVATVVGPVVGFISALVIAGIGLLGVPLLFRGLQKHKDQIEGPWDPATPVLD